MLVSLDAYWWLFFLQCFEEAIVRQNGTKEDKHIAAFAAYELGTILVKKPEVRERRRFIDEMLTGFQDLARAAEYRQVNLIGPGKGPFVVFNYSFYNVLILTWLGP